MAAKLPPTTTSRVVGGVMRVRLNKLPSTPKAVNGSKTKPPSTLQGINGGRAYYIFHWNSPLDIIILLIVSLLFSL